MRRQIPSDAPHLCFALCGAVMHCLLQHECIPYTAKKFILTRANLFKFAETFKRSREETHPEEYSHHLPSFCSHILKMIATPPFKYVFSSDFLSRGYRIDRFAAAKVWLIICLPEEACMADIANAVFTGNPDTGGQPEADGILMFQDIRLISLSSPIDLPPEILQFL